MEEGGINMADIGRQRVRIARRETFPRTMMANPDAEKPSLEISQATSSNAGTSQGDLELVQKYAEEPRSIQVIVSSSEILQATSSLNPGTSQGEDPSPSATNGRELTLDEDRTKCGSLLQAAIRGDWPAAKAFLEKHPYCVRAPISKDQGTALHNAVVAQRTTFIKELLKLMAPDDLELETIQGLTALHFAAQTEIVRIAEMLAAKNKKLPSVDDSDGRKPLQYAAELGRHRNMVSYLFSVTPLEQLTAGKRSQLILETISNDLYDLALRTLLMDPHMVTPDTGWKALEMLAKKPFAFGSESQLPFWKSRLNSWFKGISNKYLKKTLAHELVEVLWNRVQSPYKQFSSNLDQYQESIIFEAAKIGNVQFLIILIRSYPYLTWQLDRDNMSLFHFAILYRQWSVFNLIHEIGTYTLASINTLEMGENMLHLALAPDPVALADPEDKQNIVQGDKQNIVQGDLNMKMFWFREIQKIVPPSYLNKKNSKGRTLKDLFIETYRAFKKERVIWMKFITNSCMVAATFITGLAFTAAITVPGGNHQETSSPILSRSNWFIVFFLSNLIAMSTSSSTMLLFLIEIMSPHREENFFGLVTFKLMFGLSTLFVSIVGMIVAFNAACFLMFKSARPWAPVAVITSISFTFTSYVFWIYLSLLSTYKSTFLFRRRLV